jgi:ATP-binding cassette, subfamily B, bacterial HlyB/CyaB
MQTIIDRILPYERSESLGLILGLLLCAAIFQAMIGYTAGRLGLWIGTAIGQDLSLRAIDHVLRLPLTAIQKWSVGELMSRIGEVGRVQAFLGYATGGLLLDAAFALVYAAILFLISPQLAGILLLALPLQFVLYLVFGPLERRRYDRAFIARADQNALLVDSLSKSLSIKALAAEARIMERVRQAVKAAMSASMRAETLALAGRTISSLFDGGLTILVIFVGARLVLASELTLGQLISFHLLSGHVTGPVLGLAGLWDDWQNVLVARRRVGELLSQLTEPHQPDSAPALHESTASPRLELDDVTFAYPGAEPIFKRFSAIIPSRGVTLVTGPSGCGKTTLGKLAAAILEPVEGQVRLGGLPPGAHRKYVCYVPQAPELLRGTIRDNLALSVDATDDEAKAALRTVGLSHLSGHLESPIGDGAAQLSGGQSQRLCIARALLGRPSFLILDEPTSGLDEATAQKLIEAITELAGTMAVVLITHHPTLAPSPAAAIALTGHASRLLPVDAV